MAVSDERMEALSELILKTSRIFTCGAGRSELVLRMFAKRLMHLGFDAHALGDATVPSAEAGDLIIVGSGSGSTAGVLTTLKKAVDRRLRTAVISTNPDSPMGDIADLILIIPAPSLQEGGGNAASVQPMGTLFEQTMLVITDVLVLYLMERLSILESDMKNRHANLE